MRQHWTRATAATALAAAALLGVPASAEPTTAWVATHPIQQQAQHRLAALPGGAAWAVVDHNRVVKSTNFGRTWQPVTLVTAQVAGTELPYTGPDLGGSSETYVAPLSATTAYGANGSALSRTTDGGVTWQPVRTPSVTRSEFFEGAEALEQTGGQLWYARNGAEVVGGCPYILPTTPLLVTTDGSRWRRSDIPFKGGSVEEIRFADARNGVALVIEYEWSEPEENGNSCGITGSADSSGVYVTADAGRTWRRTFSCRPICRAVSWSTKGRIVLGRLDGEIFVSTTNGRSFLGSARLDPPVAAPLRALDGLDCKGARCFASFNGGGIFRSDDGGAEWVGETSPNDAFFLAIGDLAAFDAEHAVAIGPYSILTREQAPVGQARPARRRLAPGVAPGPVSVGPGTWLLPDGTMRRDVRLPLSDASRRTRAAVKAAGGVVIIPGFGRSTLLPVGDLNGDRTADLIDYRFYFDVSTDTPTDVPTMTAHSGRDGRVLWTRTVPAVTAVLPWTLGVGRPGVLLVADYPRGLIGFGTPYYGVYNKELQLTALGPDGSDAWSTRIEGAAGELESVSALAGVPFFAGTGRFNAAAGNDALVGVVDETGTGTARYSQLSALVLDGGSGAQRAAMKTSETGRSLSLTAIADIDGDGLDDLAVVGQADSQARLAAYSTGTGTLRWRGTDVSSDLGVDVRVSADVTGDRVADLVLVPAYTSPLYGTSEGQPGEVSLVDGRTGATRWNELTEQVAVPSVRGGRSAPGVLLLYPGRPTDARVEAALIGADGQPVWTVSRRLARPKNERRLPLTSIVEAGDLTGDGVGDVVYRIEVEPAQGRPRVDAGLLDGRTGVRRALPADLLTPAGGALDGRGADFVSSQVDARGLTFSAVAGSTGARLWRSTVPAPPGLDFTSPELYRPAPFTARFDADRCADVVVTIADRETIATYVFSGRDGTLLWSLLRRGRAATEVGRGRPPAARRTCA